MGDALRKLPLLPLTPVVEPAPNALECGDEEGVLPVPLVAARADAAPDASAAEDMKL